LHKRKPNNKWNRNEFITSRFLKTTVHLSKSGSASTCEYCFMLFFQCITIILVYKVSRSLVVLCYYVFDYFVSCNWTLLLFRTFCCVSNDSQFSLYFASLPKTLVIRCVFPCYLAVQENSLLIEKMIFTTIKGERN
jgi:hypothetical protein